MGEVGSYGKNISRSELAEGISDEEGPLALEYATQLDLLVLVQFGVEVIRPVLLNYKGRIVRLGDDEGQDFHDQGFLLTHQNYSKNYHNKSFTK